VDGKYLYYRNRRAIRASPPEGGAEEQVSFPSTTCCGSSSSREKASIPGIRPRRRASRFFYDFATRGNAVAFPHERQDFFQEMSFSISPDGKYILIHAWTRSQTTDAGGEFPVSAYYRWSSSRDRMPMLCRKPRVGGFHIFLSKSGLGQSRQHSLRCLEM